MFKISGKKPGDSLQGIFVFGGQNTLRLAFQNHLHAKTPALFDIFGRPILTQEVLTQANLPCCFLFRRSSDALLHRMHFF
jgi:hypothetical protein